MALLVFESEASARMISAFQNKKDGNGRLCHHISAQMRLATAVKRCTVGLRG